MKLQVDNRVLDLLRLECGGFSISCPFRNVEDDFVGCSRVYDLVLMRVEESKVQDPFRFENMWLLMMASKSLIIRSGFYWKKLHGDKNLGNLVNRWRQKHQVFHKMVNAHARRNLLTKVRTNGVTRLMMRRLKLRVCNAYHTLLLETGIGDRA
ncbi:hypothetical protein AAG906_019664 [Vitis piasezkii]